jgi:hypothetical protein
MKNFVLAVATLATGCVSSSHTVTGQVRPEVAAGTVQIYETLPANARVIGTVSASSYAGVSLRQAAGGALARLKDEAGRLGANGICLNASHDLPMSGVNASGEAIFVSP